MNLNPDAVFSELLGLLLKKKKSLWLKMMTGRYRGDRPVSVRLRTQGLNVLN